jgi:hypothetical protein
MAIQNLYPAIRPSLSLDFAAVKALDPRISFSRASEGRFYGTQVAKAEENLLLRSQEFDDAAWPKTDSTVTANNAVAPDGTTTAETLTASAANGRVLQSYTSVGGDYTFSVWLRRVTGTGDVQISVSTGATWVTQSITSSWARYTVTATLTAGSRNVGIRLVTSGDAVEVWGAQLEARDAVTAYTPTTDQPITNYIPVLQTAPANTARFDHNPVTGESLGLLIEEQRTNLLLRSEEFDNAAWTKTETTVAANTIVAPDGTLTGDKLVENTAVNVSHQLTQTQSLTANVTYTASFYAKSNGRTRIRATKSNSAAWSQRADVTFDLQNGVIVSGNGSITDAGNGWYRCSLTSTLGNANATAGLSVFIVNSGTNILYTGDGFSGIYIWGAQLEAGAFPTSYIPTVASQVTRSADAASMTGANFSSWYRQDEGTVYMENSVSSLAPTGGMWAIGDSAFAFGSRNSIYSISTASTGLWTVSQAVNGASQVSSSATSGNFVVGVPRKTAYAFQLDNTVGASNGAIATTDTSCLIPSTPNFSLSIGNLSFGWSGGGSFLNGHIRKLAYYPKRLTNAEIVGLTS